MPSFQRRHYVAIAHLIADLRSDALDRSDLYLLETVETFQARLIETFARDNARFKPKTFAAACGVSPRTDPNCSRHSGVK
jgi:hypothetical protein